MNPEVRKVLTESAKIGAGLAVAEIIKKVVSVATSRTNDACVTKDRVNLFAALADLPEEKIREIKEWMEGLDPNKRTGLALLPLEMLKQLFMFNTEKKDALLSIVLDPTDTKENDELANVKQWISNKWNEFFTLNDESKAIIKEWQEWADGVLAESKAKKMKRIS